jgi:ankyrin repeat protein
VERRMNPFKKYKQNQLNQQLLQCYNSPLSEIQELLDAGADIQAKTAEGESLLDFTTSQQNIEFFLDKGLAFKDNETLNKALHHCLDNPQMLQKLITMGGDVNYYFDRRSLLHAVIRNYNEACLVLLLENHADIDKKDGWEDTPLHDAADTGNPEAVQLLLQYHARQDITNGKEQTPIDIALKHCNESNKNKYSKIYTALLSDESFVLPFREKSYKMALSLIELNDWEAFSLLIDKGLDVNYFNSEMGSLIHHTTGLSEEGFLHTLIKAKADIDKQHPSSGNTALHRAILNKNTFSVQLLRKHHAQLDIKNNAEETPVELALRLYKETKLSCYQKMLSDFNVETPDQTAAFITNKTEISFVQENPELELRITKIFNFASGSCDVIVYNNATKNHSNSMIPFEQLEGTKMLSDAEAEFRKQGGVPVYSFKKHLDKK